MNRGSGHRSTFKTWALLSQPFVYPESFCRPGRHGSVSILFLDKAIRTLDTIALHYGQKTRILRTESSQLLSLIRANTVGRRTVTQTDKANKVICLFAAHKYSLQMLARNPYILFMDCTYKTNKYRMKLLDIIGVSSANSRFTSASHS